MITRSPIATEAPTSTTPIRVAIYCRKSVADRNGQEFGSIDAQREAVEAYVLSQRASHWTALPRRYDDEGYSGGTTKRPAFERLLTDIRDGRVNVVAVHRIDRLSRSLADFTQIMRLFGEHSVAFVATSQQFDTSTSIGKLILNILASFAEFEREMIAERTREKMAATRKRGKWTGGPIPSGYDIRDKRLVINDAEAEVVRDAFTRFVKSGSIIQVLESLNDQGYGTKRGNVFDRGTLSRMLASPLYAGRMRAGDEVVEGEHEAIVDVEVWERAQQILDANRRPQRTKRSSESLLAGLLRCASCGVAMSPTHTKRRDRMYSYYKCQSIEKRGASACPGSRIPAAGIEAVVVEKINAIGQDPKVVEATVAAARRRLKQDAAEADRLLADLLSRQDDVVAQRRNALNRLHGNASDRATHEVLGQITAELDQIESEIRETQTRTEALHRVQVHEDEIRSTLASFSAVWDELFPRERARLVRQLIDEVAYDPETDKAQIRFRPEGFRLIAGKEGP